MKYFKPIYVKYNFAIHKIDDEGWIHVWHTESRRWISQKDTWQKVPRPDFKGNRHLVEISETEAFLEIL